MPEDKKDEAAAEGGKAQTPKGKKDGGEEGEVQIQVDARANWFEEKVLTALKIKNDKWKKMLAIVENV
jgi:hypothetical protein